MRESSRQPMSYHNLPEVLAPAGDRERLIAAVTFGADAVYLAGKRFGMRAAPANFDETELAWAVSYAHAHGVRVYLTCNTLPDQSEIKELPAFLKMAADCKVDALIISDIGVFSLARRLLPDMELHVSTQAGVVNALTAQTFFEMGARRVVLARELSLEDIRAIRRETDPALELEVFVHGAMCMSVSGRCLISNYLTGRDANRGNCAQSCRWRYRLVEEKHPGEYFPIVEDDEGSYLLNAKDLSLLPYLDQLQEAGVSSFKIEGRAKSAYYVSVITNAYRMGVDLLRKPPYAPPAWLLHEVNKVSHRRYSTGFLFGKPDQYDQDGGYLRSYEVVAVVEGWENGALHCTMRNRFGCGDRIEIVSPGQMPVTCHVEALFDEAGEPLSEVIHPMMRFRLPYSERLPAGTILRKETECDGNE